MAKSKKTLAAFLAVLICIVVVVAVVMMPDGASRMPERPSDSVIYSVRSAPVTRDTLIAYIQAGGDVEARRSVDVYPDMGGKLVRTSVSLGSSVTRGQVIAEVDPSLPGVPYGISPVVAPLSGAVISQPLQPGTTVTTSTAVAVIGSIDDLQITTNVPERYAGLLETGMRAVVNLDAYPGVDFPATVVRVAPVVDAVSRTKELQLSFDRYDSRINAGMYAKIKLYTTEKNNAIVVPEVAVLTAYGKQHVFLVSEDGNTAVQCDVTTGMTVDGLTEIVDGLDDSDRVIIEGMHLLFDGSAIRDISAAGGDSV